MVAPLVEVSILSIYAGRDGARALLPKRLAQCTPDTRRALVGAGAAVREAGGQLILSELFRTHESQLRAHLDWVERRKSVFSPPPGGSLHEAGRAFDLDLQDLHIPLAAFWEIAGAHGLTPIIRARDARVLDARHFDCRGSHELVHRHYAEGGARNMKPYEAMAASAILALGFRVDRFGDDQLVAAIQCALIRLGVDAGEIDGSLGPKTRDALAQCDLAGWELSTALGNLEARLMEHYPEEFTG